MYFICPILIGKEYVTAYKYIPLLIISSIFNMLSSNISAIYVAKKKTNEIAVSTIVASILNLIINLLLIKKIGLYAAVLSTLISFLLLFLFRYIDVKKYVDIRISLKNIFVGGLLIVLSYIVYFLKSTLYKIIFLLFLIMLAAIYGKQFLKMVLKRVRNTNLN